MKLSPPSHLRKTPTHETSPTTPADSPLKLERTGATQQNSFWSEAETLLQTITSKLRSIGELDLAYGLENCGQVERTFLCRNCAALHSFATRCDKLYCPRCQPRLAARRRESIEAWSSMVKQPKHVVLTTRNSDELTRTTVATFKRNWNRTRRSKFAKGWRGGTFALEVTNESRGWHLHSHSLIDANFIAADELAKLWAKKTGQDFAIVKVKDARDRSYLAEVTKYAVKGSQMAVWSPTDIAAFIRAFARTKTFMVFGTLFKMRAEWEATRPKREGWKCTCGSNQLLPTFTSDLLPDQPPSNHSRPVFNQPELPSTAPIWPD